MADTARPQQVADGPHPQQALAEVCAQRDQALKELAALRAEVQALMSSLSHDLRAPLRHVSAYLQLVREDAGPQLSAEVLGFSATASGAAQQLGGMLDALLELSRAGSTPLQVQPLPLQALLQTAVQEALARAQALAPQRQMTCQLAPDFPLVQADAALLRKALAQVLDNALKFTQPREQAVLELRWLPVAGTSRVAIEVRDNGVGYNAAQQERLFGVFQPLHPPAQLGGLGTGLALVRKIMQRLDGQASISCLEPGCCVTLELPQA